MPKTEEKKPAAKKPATVEPVVTETAAEATTQATESAPETTAPEEVVAPAKSEAPIKEVVAAGPKMVRCVGLKNHRCIIAGEQYIIEEKKEHLLPDDVATILTHAHKVYRK